LTNEDRWCCFNVSSGTPALVEKGLRKKLKDIATGKLLKNNALTPQWLVRVCLSMPTVSSRAFHQAHVDLVGMGKRGAAALR